VVNDKLGIARVAKVKTNMISDGSKFHVIPWGFN